MKPNSGEELTGLALFTIDNYTKVLVIDPKETTNKFIIETTRTIMKNKSLNCT